MEEDHRIVVGLFGEMRVTGGGTALSDISGKPKRMLACVALCTAHAGYATRTQIEDAVWPGERPTEGTYRQAVKRLRDLWPHSAPDPLEPVNGGLRINRASVRIDALELKEALSGVGTGHTGTIERLRRVLTDCDDILIAHGMTFDDIESIVGGLNALAAEARYLLASALEDAGEYDQALKLADKAVQTATDQTTASKAELLATRIRDGVAAAAGPLEEIVTRMDRFFGRAEETEVLEDEIAVHRLVTITGMGGSGKSRLAVHVANCLIQDSRDPLAGRSVGREHFDTVRLVELAGLAGLADVVAAVSGAVGYTPKGTITIDGICSHVGSRRILLVADNCDGLLSECREVLGKFLRKCHNARILATSQVRIGIEIEQQYPIVGLARPRSRDEARAANMRAFPAVELFVERSGKKRVANDEEAGDIAEICIMLEGFPLLIELAAAWTQAALTPGDILRYLSRNFDFLDKPVDGLPERHQALGNLVTRSLELLGDGSGAQRMFPKLAVFRGGWTPEAAATVCLGSDTDISEAMDPLRELVRYSLIVSSGKPGDPRYRMVEAVRSHVERKMLQGNDGALRRAHKGYYFSLVEAAYPHIAGNGDPAWKRRLDEDIANVRAAIRHGVSGGDDRDGTYLAAGQMTRYWRMVWAFTEAADTMDSVLAGSEDAHPTPSLLLALNGAGSIAFTMGRFSESASFYGRAITKARSVGDLDMLAMALRGFAHVSIQSAQFDAAGDALQESLDISNATGNMQGIGLSVFHLAGIRTAQGQFEEAEKMLDESINIWKNVSSSYSSGIYNKALIRLATGDVETAFMLAKEADDLDRSRGESGMAGALLSRILIERGELAAAREALKRHLAAQAGNEHRVLTATLHGYLGLLHQQAGDFGPARKHLTESLSIFQDSGSIFECVCSVAEIGLTLSLAEDHSRAVRALSAAFSLQSAYGFCFWPCRLPSYEAALHDSSARMDVETRTMAISLGEKMSLKEALEFCIQCASN